MIPQQGNSYLELNDLISNTVAVSTTYHGESARKYKNKIIIYSQIGELYQDDQIINMLTNSNSYYIILVSHHVSPEIIQQFSHNATFIKLNYVYSYYTENIEYKNIDLNLLTCKLKSKYFLSLNNRASWPRQGLFYFFKKYELLDKSYFSYIGELTRTGFNSLNDIDNPIIDTWYIENLDLGETKKCLPLTTKLDNFSVNDWSLGNVQYYQDCFLSIVMETYNYEKYPFFTEKTFKPIIGCQPFIIHGNPGCLTELKNAGFKTFDRWFDESYDNLADHNRFEAIARIILEISSWSLEKINEVYQEMLPILKHNREHFEQNLPKLYRHEIAQVKEQINNIINTV